MIQFNVSNAADQQFGAILGGRRVTLRLRFNPSNSRWSLDVAVDDQWLVHARRIVVGVDLLKPFKLGIGVIFSSWFAQEAEPNWETLPGGIVGLFHVTEEELEEV